MDDSSRAYQCQTNKEGRPCQDVFLTLGTKYVGPDKCPPCVTKGEERKKKAKEAGRWLDRLHSRALEHNVTDVWFSMWYSLVQ